MLDNGDSTLIISPKGKKIIIDGGEKEQKVLTAYLLARKIKTIDYAIISHFDSDHFRRNKRNNRKFKSKKFSNYKTDGKNRRNRRDNKFSKEKEDKNINCKSREQN